MTVLDELKPGCTVALADGGDISPVLCSLLSDAARRATGVRLILGWCYELPVTLDLTAFAEVRTYFVGSALSRAVRDGLVRYVPATFASLPKLFQSVWRPDLVVCTSRPGRTGLTLGTQVGWIPSAVRAAGAVVTEVNHALPYATRRDALAQADVEIVSECERRPTQLPNSQGNHTMPRIGSHVATLIREGAAVQYPPGALGRAVLDQLEVPVRVMSGVVDDSLVDLDERGLLLGEPLCAYLAGTDNLYRWAHERAILAEPEQTHDVSTLVEPGLVAVNSALQVDLAGQVNVEFAGDHPIAALGGQSDFASAAARSLAGVSVIALPSERNGIPTLVRSLLTPTSTARSHVEFIVTEYGIADLRGVDDAERALRLRRLWPTAEI